MSLIKCPDCKHKISKSATSCPYCGRPMKGNNVKTSKNNNVGCSTYVFLAIFVLLAIGWGLGQKDNKSSEAGNLKSTHQTETASTSTGNSSPTEVYITELYNNWRDYEEQYVKVSGRISEISDDEFKMYDKTANHNAELIVKPRTMPSDIQVKDWVTVNGLVSEHSYSRTDTIENADVIQTGSDAKDAYKILRKAYFKENPEEKPATPTPKPEPVSVENSTTLYYLDLYENYKEYNDQYVTISAPIESADGEDVIIKGAISGIGEISLTLLEPRSDLKPGDFITATGLVQGRMFKILYLENVNISATGDGPAQLYAQQKDAYASSVAQAQANSQQEFANSCQRYNYEDLVRYPDSYEDSPITDTVVVEQVMPGGFLTSEGYRCYEVGTENEIVLLDDRENKEPKFVEGDTVTVYGTYYGTEKMERLFTGEKVSVPCINFQYANIN